MKKILALLLFAGSVNFAYAWGDREQGVLTGIASILLFQKLEQNSNPQPPVVIQRAPTVVVPSQPIYNREYYNCIVPVYDPISRTFKNEVMLCVR